MNGGSGAVEMLCDLSSGLVEFDAGQVPSGGRKAYEVAGSASGLQHPNISLDAELFGCLPHRSNNRSRRVVSIESCSPGLHPAILGAEQLAQFSPLIGIPVVVRIEHLRDRTPPGPASKYHLLVGVCPPATVVATEVQYPQCVEIGSEFGSRSWGRKLILTGWPKGRRAR